MQAPPTLVSGRQAGPYLTRQVYASSWLSVGLWLSCDRPICLTISHYFNRNELFGNNTTAYHSNHLLLRSYVSNFAVSCHFYSSICIYGFDGTFIVWFTSYLSGRTQWVNTAGSTSPSTTWSCGVPQGSVLGLILFILYTADLMSIVKRHQLLPHANADYVQIYGSCASSEVGTLQ